MRALVYSDPTDAAKAQFDGPLRDVGESVRFIPKPVSYPFTRMSPKARSTRNSDTSSTLLSGTIKTRHWDTWVPTYSIEYQGESGITSVAKRVPADQVFDPEEVSTAEIRGSHALEACKERGRELQLLAVDLDELEDEEPEGAEYLRCV